MMRSNILFLNQQFTRLIKNFKGNKIGWCNRDHKKYRHFFKEKQEQTRCLYVCQEKCNNEQLNTNNNMLFYLSLLCIPFIINKKMHNENGDPVSCISFDTSDKVEKSDEKLEKVFLIKKNDIKKGELLEIKVHNEKDSVLLINVHNKYYCLGPKCPHYSAPLQNGLLTEKYVVCPWHDAKFCLKTGECINGPSFYDIPSFKVEVEGDNIYAYLPKEINISKEKKICLCKDRCEKKTILIIGGGAATLGAIETFLKNGFSGKLVVCSKDSFKPYDRTSISKTISKFSNVDELYESIKLKQDDYYDNNNITYINNVSVTKVDHENKKAYLDNGNVISYDQVLITTGLRPRSAEVKILKDVKPSNLLNIYNLTDNWKLSNFAKEGSKCVIIGSSFIGCEIASALRKKKVNVSMVTINKVPFDNIFREKIGNVILNILKENNVNFYGDVSPVEYIIDNRFLKLKNTNAIHGVKLNNGEVLGCDFVIESIGCIPNTDFLNAKFKNKNNFIITDKHFKVQNAEDMYAAGDVCCFPYYFTNEMLNICHWNVAIQQGRIAAHNMLNSKKMEFQFLPFFNTNIMGNNFRVCGFASMYDKIIYEGDLSKKNFVCYFVKNDKVISILTLGNSKMPALNECLSLNKAPKPYELEAGLKNSDSMIQLVKL